MTWIQYPYHTAMTEETVEEALHPEPIRSVSLYSRAVLQNGERPLLPLVPTAVYPVALRMIFAGMLDEEIAPLLGYRLEDWRRRKSNLAAAFPEEFPSWEGRELMYCEIARMLKHG